MIRRSVFAALIVVMLSATTVMAAPAKIKVTNTAFTPATKTVKVGKPTKWKNLSNKKHNASPTINWSWGAVDIPAGGASSVVIPTQAGTYPYYCALHPAAHTGTLAVSMIVSPLAGSTATAFTVTQGTVQSPGVSTHELEVSKDGGPWTLKWNGNAPSVQVFFQQPGTYDLRSRLRWQLGGQTTGWSPISTVVVF
jgi:plastocyanin